jgi:hypothetical protein
MLTVKQLIEELQNYPSSSYIGIRMHDNAESELQGHVNYVSEFIPKTSFDPKFCENTFVVLDT